MNAILHSTLYSTITRYINIKRALGRGYHKEEKILMSLDEFMIVHNLDDLNIQNFNAWCQTKRHLASGSKRNHMRVVRNFCLYRQREEPESFVPDNRLFPSPHPTIRPHIFSEEQIIKLIQATSTLPPTPVSLLRAEVFRVAIVLLYTTGLRRGELLRLTLGDYDWTTQTLTVTESKYHHTRYCNGQIS